MTLLLAAFFLPLFPFSVLLSVAATRLPHPAARATVLLIWPHIGVYLLESAAVTIPDWLGIWAVATSALYALRMLTARDLYVWTGFLATSSYSLIWLLAASDGHIGAGLHHAFAFGFSLPAALLALLAGSLARQLGAPYCGLHGGLGRVLPRLSLLLVLTVLAAIATPPFPGFFVLLGMWLGLAPWALVAVLLVWLIWGWAAARMLQGFIYGPPQVVGARDLASQPGRMWGMIIVSFALFGFYVAWSTV